jgi:integrase
MDRTRLLYRDEVKKVLEHLHAKSRRLDRAKLHLAIFRLSCCCGLRCKEIAGLEMRDIRLEGPRPVIDVRKEITKGRDGKRKARRVPLWWDAGTADDLRMWRDFRLKMGATTGIEPFLCSLRADHLGERLARGKIASHWGRAIAALGPERASQLSIHTGRHSFCSHALDAGRSAAEVRDAAGHSSVAITDIYLHALDSGAGDIFDFDDED